MAPAPSATPRLDDDALVDGLRTHGIRYLTGGSPDADPGGQPLPAVELLIGLARSADARVRQAIAPLLLTHPELADYVPDAANALGASSRGALVEAYVAAVYLHRAWRTRLRRFYGEQPLLPTLWIDELGLPDPDKHFGRAGLTALRARHRRGPTARRGAYEQAALNLFGQLLAERGGAPAVAAA